jgi:hypothetical protein
VATNAGGTTRSPDATFRTLAKPVLSKVTLKPKQFRDSGRKPIGATITYRDSTAAKTKFAISAVGTGKRAKRGSFSHTDKAGLNKVRFTGRIGGKRLSPGAYSLQLVASNTAGKSRPIHVRFRILG